MNKKHLKLGLVFGITGAILGLINAIPFLSCLTWVISFIIGLVAGYITIYIFGGTKEKLADVMRQTAVIGALVGLIVGVGEGIGSIINTLAFSNSYFFVYAPSILTVFTGFIGAFFAALIFVIFCTILGGIAAVYFESSRLPKILTDYMAKIKIFVEKP